MGTQMFALRPHTFVLSHDKNEIKIEFVKGNQIQDKHVKSLKDFISNFRNIANSIQIQYKCSPMAIFKCNALKNKTTPSNTKWL